MSDLIAVLTWWLLVQAFSLAALPLAFRLFQRLPDRGYSVSKALGLLLPSYLFWILGVLGFLRNDTGGILLSIAIVTGGSLLFYSRSGSSESQISNSPSESTLSSWLRANWKWVLTVEILFTVAFGGWALYRAYVPRIMTAGGEKFMELAFLNGFKRSATLPPLDPWLSGFAISYYYFGYLMMSILIRLSGVTPQVGFNIGGALLFALTVTGAFGLVYNLVASFSSRRLSRPEQENEPGINPPSPRRSIIRHPIRDAWVWTALLGVVLVALLGNFEGPLEVAHWKGLGSDGLWRWLDIDDLDQPPASLEGTGTETRLTRTGWWWWRASRVIFDYDVRDWPNRLDKTHDPAPVRRENIDEFPFFSFLLGDMHPHVLALPFLMLALTVALTLFRIGLAAQPASLATPTLMPMIPSTHLFLFALILGALGFLNTWDFPVQWAVAVGAFTWGRLSKGLSNQATSLLALFRPHMRAVLTIAAILGPGALLLYAPFFLGLQTQAGGPLVHVHSSTRLSQFGIMFGPLLFILVSFLAWGVVRARQRQALALRTGVWTGTVLLLLALTLLVLTSLAIIISPSVRDLIAPGLADEAPVEVALRYLNMRLSTPWVTLLLAGIIGVAVALLRPGGLSRTAQFSLLLVIAGAIMTLIPDYVYLKDVFGVRINTVFKFYFQAWVLWAVASAGGVYEMLIGKDSLRATTRVLYGAGLALVVGLGLVYPVLAIPDRVKEFPEAPTLDGTIYLAREQAADYEAIQWLNTYVKGAPVILETPGGAYQYEGRVSAQTGLPTLLGWTGHEHQWRGSTIEQDKRARAVREICTTGDPQRTLTLLDEYDITFVYVGSLERINCPASGLGNFDRLMEIVYDRDGVKIYKRRDALGGHFGE